MRSRLADNLSTSSRLSKRVQPISAFHSCRRTDLSQSRPRCPVVMITKGLPDFELSISKLYENLNTCTPRYFKYYSISPIPYGHFIRDHKNERFFTAMEERRVYFISQSNFLMYSIRDFWGKYSQRNLMFMGDFES